MRVIEVEKSVLLYVNLPFVTGICGNVCQLMRVIES